MEAGRQDKRSATKQGERRPRGMQIKEEWTQYIISIRPKERCPRACCPLPVIRITRAQKNKVSSINKQEIDPGDIKRRGRRKIQSRDGLLKNPGERNLHRIRLQDRKCVEGAEYVKLDRRNNIHGQESEGRRKVNYFYFHHCIQRVDKTREKRLLFKNQICEDREGKGNRAGQNIIQWKVKRKYQRHIKDRSQCTF